MRNDRSSPTEQTNPVLPSYEARNQPVALTAKSAPVVLPEDHELTWVTVLLPARVHAGPSVDTPTTQFYAVGTLLHARRYWNDWIEVVEPGTSKSGWIYRKYLGAISNYEQGKIASQEAQAQRSIARPVSAKRYANIHNRLVSSRSLQDPSVAKPKWQVCCSEHSVATEEITCTFLI
jgi:hypothetical protein